MCLAIKEGKYPPPPPMGKSFIQKIITYARECLSHRFFILMFAHNMVWRAASAVAVFQIFLYLSLGLTSEAQTAGAILGHNYQSTEWYQDAYTLLTGQGLRPEAEGDSWLAQIYRQVVRGEWL